jgi:hypothetical protein
MYAYGLTIAVWMHCWSVAPRIFLEAAVAQSLRRRMSRFGPTVPVALAAASVWQDEQPAVPTNTALPAAAEPELELLEEVEEPDALDVLEVLELLDVLELDEPDELDDGEPGTPGWTASGGGVPIGGVAFGFCELIHA